MADQDLIHIVQSIKDNLTASIELHTTTGRERHLDCIYKKSTPPNFRVVFPSEKIPENLNTNKPCTLSFIEEGSNVPEIKATITSITDDNSLELIAKSSVDPASLREYFRIGLRTHIVISYEGSSNSKNQKNWTIQGQTLDLSGSGVLGLFPDKPNNSHNIFIEIHLTHPEQRILCIGHVVRTRRLSKGKWQIALHFDNISTKTRDAIITNCLWEQRRQLRERIQI